MPQFDFFSALAQFGTCFLGFVVFYFLAVKFILPLTFTTLRFREKLFHSVSSVSADKIKASKLISKILKNIIKK